MSDQQVLRDGANARQHLLDRQVNMFLFDLKNEATELGFKTNDSWHLELANNDDIINLKRHHTPVVVMKLQPDDLLNAYRQIKNGLQQSLSTTDSELTVSNIARNEKSHLVAYPVRSGK